jgi:hypothetical protein
MLSDVLEELQGSRHLSLYEQIDLKVEMAPLIGLASKRFFARGHLLSAVRSRQQNRGLPSFDGVKVLAQRGRTGRAACHVVVFAGERNCFSPRL